MRPVVVRLLRERGVELEDVALIVYELQRDYCPGLTPARCLESVTRVLAKREVQYALLTGIALDQLAEQGGLPEPLLSILRRDDPLYGVDEVLALAITNVYGSIGLTNFGYLDKLKLGVLGRLNRPDGNGRVHTFLDDLVAGLAAAAAAKLAHEVGGRR
ncbi:MAG: phosphatidylglycerophosphatase A [Clostridia bacterium]|nr:phosphatidylglycerophosphatase A [Clostridia bacterium]